MRTSVKILRIIGRWLTRLDWEYAAPSRLGPWSWYYYSPYYYRCPK